ncbi:MAG: serine/threonine protein kinase [Planctomycetota bacterium]|jgi:serine/threonine-protein kinase
MSKTDHDTMFGRMALEQGLCTEEELHRSLEEFESRLEAGPVRLRDLMVELGYVTQSQAERLKTGTRQGGASTNGIGGYKILAKLGAGATATVYKAKHLALDRTVAIKVLSKRFSEKPEYVQRFYREGQAAARLNHINIVHTYDVGEDGGHHYLVMEYVEGKTLYDDLSAGKVFKEGEALEIIIQVAHALGHAHSQGLVHRDVQPKNIMIDAGGVVKLGDMGIAREIADVDAAQSEAGKTYGTPYYIAPEQIRGKVDTDGRADIYALGATFYHLITGQVPFMADNAQDVLRKHLTEQLTPPDHKNPSLSTAVSEVIEVMMAKRREDRYNDIAELLTDLEAVRNGELPLRAHERFDYSVIEQLEDGEPVETEKEETVYKDETLARYQIALLTLGTVAAVSLLGVVLLISRLF